MATPHFYINPPFSGLSALSSKMFGTLPLLSTQFLEGPKGGGSNYVSEVNVKQIEWWLRNGPITKNGVLPPTTLLLYFLKKFVATFSNVYRRYLTDVSSFSLCQNGDKSKDPKYFSGVFRTLSIINGGAFSLKCLTVFGCYFVKETPSERS